MAPEASAPFASLGGEQPEEERVAAHTESLGHKPQPTGTLAARGRRHGGTPGAPLPALLLAAGAAAAAFILLLRRKRGGGRVRRAAVGKHQVFSAVLALREPSVPLPPPASATLAQRTLVLSDRLAVQSLETRFGCQAWKNEQQPAHHTYGPADALVAAGAQGTAVVHGEPLGLGPLLSLGCGGTPNPAGAGRSHGGGEYGAAVSVAAGLSDLALAVDELGSARVPAACCGAYALRTSAGVLPLERAAVTAPSLAAPALLAADPQLLLKAGQALRLPGGGAATEVPNYLVAEDFFAACGEEARRMVPAVVAAVKRWAGPEQAQALSLCEWLHHRVASLAPFMPRDGAAAPAAAPAKRHRSEQVLGALAAVAGVLRQWEFARGYGPWVEAHQQQLDAGLLEFWRQALQVDEERYRAARAAAAELQSAMRSALLDGYIFVLPTTPGPAPPEAAGSEGGVAAAAAFRERCEQFAAVAALSGVPQAVLPLPLAGDAPLSVSLLALHKRDLALLQAAAKLGPILAEEAAALAAQLKAGTQPGWQPEAVAATAAAAGADPGHGVKRGSNGRRKLPGSEQAAAAAAAEQRKQDGNAAFRAGRYDEAVRQYSAAIQLHPQAAVYHANRAMAYLKLGAYGAAEADCDASLKLELTAKALLRRASARLAQGDVDGAKADFRQVLALEPQNRQAREELRGIEAMQAAEQAAGF